MMDYIHINKLITKSIYKQIADSITEAIDKGELQYNDKLPTEKEICQLFSISQTVVKKAYEQLILDGKIRRIKGKGTYVTNRDVIKTDLHSFYNFEIMNQENESKITKETIILDRSNKDISSIRELKLKNDEKYYLIVNLFKSKHNPILLQRIYLPMKYYKKLDTLFDSNFDIFQLIEHTYHYDFTHMHSSFSPINASKADSLLLNIEADDALYLVRTKMIDSKDNVICYICNYYPGEFTEFEVTVHAI